MITEAIEGFGLSKKDSSKSLFSKIGIIGCGKEGSVLATVAATNGVEVVFLEPSEEQISNAYARIERNLNSKITSWGLTVSEKHAIMSRIKGVSEYNALRGCEFVIECVRYDDNTGERSDAQRIEVFKQLESILSADAIIASNTSTPVITEFATNLQHKERCIGVHVMSNMPEARILEIVKCLYTSQEVYDKVALFAKLINYQSISVTESAGLVSIRLYFAMLNEACSLLSEGVSNVKDIDEVMKVGFGNTQGVFRTADQMGIEKVVMLMRELHLELGAVKYSPSPVLMRMYRAKQFGVSRKKGFYNYDDNGNIISVNYTHNSYAG